MAYQRGRYGIEYHPPVNREAHRLRWILPCLALLVAVSYGVARVRRAKPFRRKTNRRHPPLRPQRNHT